ncbi:MAG: General stress protein 69 [Planctomycetes bacterium ADurb.Bin126]|nr:MAG: General stress protein 69 [Planctomycetes bacterium ADurb.Bin126]HOD80680.1 aldo/keto reductase [Phycisphaerae bacterium]HQL73016.1 aldo/keto reductase [Phycisphaerae bacterium]
MSGQEKRKLTRREFLETASAAAGVAACGSAAQGAQTSGAGGMKYRRLGRTGLKISEIGLGCASGLRSRQLGETLFNRYREELPAIVHKLLEHGGNFVATSASYHDTEEILGRALKGRRKEAYIFTASGAKTPEKIIAECERSLQRFQTDVIDGYFCHGGWREEFLEAAGKLKQQGKIRFIGESIHVPAKHRPQVEAGVLDFLLQPYNYMNLAKWTEQTDRPGTEDLLKLCRKKDVGVMVIKPMTGHFVPNWAKNADDPKVSKLLGELKEFGKANLYQAFLMWVLKNPNVSCAIVGFNAVNDVVDDCQAVGRKLTRRHERLLEQYAAAATADYCRMCETCAASCPAGLPIADILRYRMYYQNYGHRADAREYYAALGCGRQADACIACGACEKACPNGLAVMAKLREAHQILA